MIPEPLVAITTATAKNVAPPPMYAAVGRSCLTTRPAYTPPPSTGRNVRLDTIAVRRSLDGTTSARVNTVKHAKIRDV
ncbi:MAG: hypothetical protein H6Q90_7274 [Deltaproteobacteria bacterium]|nr:hypothetical protein [Deltaproteobacteria bacterium]